MDADESFEQLRPLLFSIAYRMVGSVGDAEDLVQESFLRFHRALEEEARIDSPKAYLSTIVTRLSIDHLHSARVRRETYVGEWLPEPLVTDGEELVDDPARHAETADSLSTAFLVLLESLSPVERAVFLLHDVFAYAYEEVAPIVDKSVENCRQLAVRARRHVEARKPRFEATREQREELAKRFFAAIEGGDLDELVAMLAEDAVMVGDGGGKAPAVTEPIHGAIQVARFLLGLARQAAKAGISLRPRELNGQPGAIATGPHGGPVSALTLDIGEGRVRTIHSIVNPDKLGHLGTVEDLRELLRRRGSASPGVP